MGVADVREQMVRRVSVRAAGDELGEAALRQPVERGLKRVGCEVVAERAREPLHGVPVDLDAGTHDQPVVRQRLATARDHTVLVGLEALAPGIPRGGYSVFKGGAKIGAITSGTKSPSLGKAIALAYLASAEDRLKEAANVLKTRPDDVVDRVRLLVEERKQLERDLAAARKQIALGGGAAAGGAGDASAEAGVRTIGAGRLLDSPE